MRLDKALAEKFGSRSKAADAIERGLVKVNGKIASRSQEIRDSDVIEFIEPAESYVSAGGFKLAKALRDFDLSVKGLTIADIGASTGGFTDCLFQNGAEKVYCVDVGKGQLDPSLSGKNIVVMDGVNARYLTADMFGPLDGATCDVSFISLKLVLPSIAAILSDGGIALTLVKPQFECGQKNLTKDGFCRDAKVRHEVLLDVLDAASGLGLAPQNVCEAPIVEGKNVEYVAYFVKGGAAKALGETVKNLR